jgi:hypothetical protein
MDDDDIKQEADGTFTIDMDLDGVEPIRGIPTRGLADHIAKQMWAMERSGARGARMDD